MANGGRPAQLRPDQEPKPGLPPFDATAEQMLLGAVLLDDNAIFRVAYLVRSTDFFRAQNEWVYEAALHLMERSETIDVPTVAHELDRDGRLDEIGGEPYLAELVAGVYTAVGVEAHARIIARDSLYRQTITAAGKVAQQAYVGGHDSAGVLSAWQDELDALQQSGSLAGDATMEQVVREIHERGLDPQERRGVTTGFIALDQKLHGLAPGEVVCIGARTSNAKTALAIAMALRQATNGVTVGYVPIEGDRVTLTHRMAGSIAGESLYTARQNGGWSEHGLQRYTEALNEVARLPMFYPGHYMSSITDICAWATMKCHQDGLQVLYIDHIDAASSASDLGRAAEIANMMRTIEQTARREQIVIVFLSQVNRQAKPDRMPHMNELREAGMKEELSQVVIMLMLQAGELHIRVEKNSEGLTGGVYQWDNSEGRGASMIFESVSSSLQETGSSLHVPTQVMVGDRIIGTEDGED